MNTYINPMALHREAIPPILRELDRTIERVGEESDVWEITFFTPGGKWKYNDYVVMMKSEQWVDFDVLIQDALDNTPKSVRETTIKSIVGWTVVMMNNPLGFPIMVQA